MVNNCVHLTQECSGCGVCAAVCPQNALTVSINQDGFFEAVVNEQQCVSCGKCLVACPKMIQQETSSLSQPYELYAAWSKDTVERKSSASGGLASVIAKWGIKNGYKVAGVIYDATLGQARTLIASSVEETTAFKGSKYLQSYTVDAFKEVLKSQEKYIVFGTPCQIAGMHKAAVLFGRRNNLILVDCFCHGVPSYLVWQLVCKEYFPARETWDKVVFRDKSGGWHNFLMTLHKGENKILSVKEHKNPFYQLFFSDLCMNSSCYACQAKKIFSFADIRLGDFWGNLFDLNEKGVSAAVICSERGKQIFTNCIEEKRIVAKLVSQEKLIPFQSAFRSGRRIPLGRKEIMRALKKREPLAFVLKKAKSYTPTNQHIREKVKALLPVFVYKYFRYWMHI